MATITHLKTHIKRLFQYDENGVKNPDVWIDVQRIDQMAILDDIGQRYWLKLKWFDDPNDIFEGKGNPLRINRSKTIVNPDDPTMTIDIKDVRGLVVKDDVGQRFGQIFQNIDTNNLRKIKSVEVNHQDLKDTSINDNLNNDFIVPGQDYFDTLDTTTLDTSQRLQVEVIDAYIHNGDFGQRFINALKNKYLE